MTQPEPVRTALIGYGPGGSVFLAPLIAATDGMEMTAQQRHPGVTVVGSPDDIWRTARDFDLVAVTPPNASHAPLTLAALEAGLPAGIDKPVAATTVAAESLRDAAAERDLMVSVFHNRRWDGACCWPAYSSR